MPPVSKGQIMQQIYSKATEGKKSEEKRPQDETCYVTTEKNKTLHCGKSIFHTNKHIHLPIYRPTQKVYDQDDKIEITLKAKRRPVDIFFIRLKQASELPPHRYHTS